MHQVLIKLPYQLFPVIFLFKLKGIFTSAYNLLFKYERTCLFFSASTDKITHFLNAETLSLTSVTKAGIYTGFCTVWSKISNRTSYKYQESRSRNENAINSQKWPVICSSLKLLKS